MVKAIDLGNERDDVAVYYWARLCTGQLQRGDPYTALRRCVVVLITSFAELTNQRFHSIFQVHERYGGELLTGHLELHLLELPKLPSALDRNDEPNLALRGKFLSAGADERARFKISFPERPRRRLGRGRSVTGCSVSSTSRQTRAT
jgi:hypothetical protein